MRKISLHFLIFSSFPLRFLFISSFSLHFLAARLQGCNDSCSPDNHYHSVAPRPLCTTTITLYHHHHSVPSLPVCTTITLYHHHPSVPPPSLCTTTTTLYNHHNSVPPPLCTTTRPTQLAEFPRREFGPELFPHSAYVQFL
jgi:hypothetical protein